MAHVSTRESSRNDGIDLLRGFAILMVVIHHCALKFRLPLAPSWLGQVLDKRWTDALSFNGYESVFIFFVVSGFVITRSVIERDGALAALDWKAFYMRRFARIVPLLGILLCVLSILHLMAVPTFVIHGKDQSLPGALLSALSMSLNWYEGRTDWLPGGWDVLWSLSIEEAFYLAFPLLCLTLRGKVGGHVRLLLLLALAVSLPWTHAALEGNEIWQEKAYLPGMAAISIGVLTALMTRHVNPSVRTARALKAGGVLGIFAVFCYGDFLWQAIQHHTLLLLCVAAACVLAGCHASPRPAPQCLRWLSHPGRWSYEIYLSHMFIVLPANGLYHWFLGDDLRWTCLMYIPVLILSVLLGRLLHRHFAGPAAHFILQSGLVLRPQQG